MSRRRGRDAEEIAITQRVRHLNSALNNMSQGLCLFDAENRLLVWNDRYVQMYRIDPRRIWVGCTIRDLLDARIAAGTFPLDPDRYDHDLRAALSRGTSYTIDIELADGRTVVVANQRIDDGGWVATHDDITARVNSERELHKTRVFLDKIIDNVPSPIVVKEVPSLRYLLVNRAAEKQFGHARKQMIGKTATDVFPKAVADYIQSRDREMLDAGREMFFDEHALVTPAGGNRIVTTTRLPIIGADGTPEYMIGVIQDVTERKRSEARIAHLAHHDPLTDLPNRSAFNECLQTTIERAVATKESFALFCMDLDRFKAINDVFGQSAGDALLREVGRRLEQACQGAFLARLGGDEFTIITPLGQQPATAEALADRLSAALAADIIVGDHPVRAAITVGVAIFPNDGADAPTLVANADAALYRAKMEARGSLRFFQPDMDKRLREKRALQHDLRSAIANDELELHYQPQASISGEITGFEALVRWHHPHRGLIPPGQFIPLAEESGLILTLGEWILRAACREAASWPRPLRIAINLSPIQFQHGDLTGFVHGLLLETGLAPGRLEFEITEGVLIGDFARTVAILRRLKNLGVRIAMDDFGTGYSSLSYLQSFPFDKIKIDRAFIANLGSSPQAAAIVRAVIGLGRGLDVPIVAEGVETEEQRTFLASESCDELQGFLIGRPMPIANYAKLVGRDFTTKKAAAG
ncbi:MAG TPA: EAL domain-containing protein [Pseudolabrys sp.]|nr:EAL domain-containing protein [Pseudolabrys sp.]